MVIDDLYVQFGTEIFASPFAYVSYSCSNALKKKVLPPFIQSFYFSDFYLARCYELNLIVIPYL